MDGWMDGWMTREGNAPCRRKPATIFWKTRFVRRRCDLLMSYLHDESSILCEKNAGLLHMHTASCVCVFSLSLSLSVTASQNLSHPIGSPPFIHITTQHSTAHIHHPSFITRPPSPPMTHVTQRTLFTALRPSFRPSVPPSLMSDLI